MSRLCQDNLGTHPESVLAPVSISTTTILTGPHASAFTPLQSILHIATNVFFFLSLNHAVILLLKTIQLFPVILRIKS